MISHSYCFMLEHIFGFELKGAESNLGEAAVQVIEHVICSALSSPSKTGTKTIYIPGEKLCIYLFIFHLSS